MDVILLEKISNLGELGDLVSVKPGYARNFLVPQSKAVWATAGAKTRVDERRRELAQLDAERLEVAQAKSDLLPAELTLQRNQRSVCLMVRSRRLVNIPSRLFCILRCAKPWPLKSSGNRNNSTALGMAFCGKPAAGLTWVCLKASNPQRSLSTWVGENSKCPWRSNTLMV